MKEVPYDLLKRYSDGLTDASENRRLMEWLLEDKENERVFADIISVTKAAEVVCDGRFESNRQAFMERLSRNIDRQKAEVSKRRLGRAAVAFAAGIAAVLAGLSVFIFRSSDDGSISRVPRSYVSYSNTKNDSDIITLPDGSTVWMMKDATVRYSETGSKGIGRRDVQLEGEAFFDVAKDTLRPFVVRTSDLSVVAVGTRFNVRVKEEENTEVMLEEGSVRLCNPQGVNLMRLLPNQAATLDLASGDIFIEQRYVQSEVRLKYNVIALTDATVGEIVENIEKSYGVRIKVKGVSDAGKRYNFCCLKSRGVEEALAVLSSLTGSECVADK